MKNTALHNRNVSAWDMFSYKCIYYQDFDYELFKHIDLKYKTKKGKVSYNDIIIMADTETSKPLNYPKCINNYIVAWSIAFRAFGRNLVTLYGYGPYEFTDMLKKLRENLPGDDIYIYFHNLSYDWVFIRKFMFEAFGYPDHQLNTKPLNPLFIRFKNNIVLRDSLALAQRSLQKWADDLQTEHRKAVGRWDYEKTRNQQGETFTPDEIDYIEHDVLAGVECIDATMKVLKKHISSMPLTCTGIVRGEARAAGGRNAHNYFVRVSPLEYDFQLIQQLVFHGGFTKANRYVLGLVYKAICYDICSSYPTSLLVMKAPVEKFFKCPGKVTIKYIMEDNPNYAFIFRIKLFKPRLKEGRYPMPCISHSKCIQSINAVLDNGRVLKGDYLELWTNELDFSLILKMYTWDDIVIPDAYMATKDYLPKWFTDFVYERFIKKTKLKGVDIVLYMIEKGMLNSCFGMASQQPCKPLIVEDYETGDYAPEDMDLNEQYKKHLKNPKSFLPYVWGIYCTSYSMLRLFELGECVDYDNGGIWLYSDTDSVYATAFDEKKLKAYNEKIIKEVSDRGYGPVEFNEKFYNLGVAELDGVYSEFKTWHSKCYAARDAESGKLKITVAGVPKKGVEVLDDDIANFVPGLVFPGTVTGKLEHKHLYIPDIYQDENGNYIGDSIDLTPCDYLLRSVNDVNWDVMESAEVGVAAYYEEDLNVL